MVVNDYSKAKSLVSDNAPIVFKKGTTLLCTCILFPQNFKLTHFLVFHISVLEEVESKVEKFRNQLRSRLSILPIPLKDMRRYIKYDFHFWILKT
jgi:hypothetical protein